MTRESSTPQTALGFCYTCFGRGANVIDVLESVRSQYPNAPIVLSCDGGDDFETLCERYRCCWDYHSETIGRHFGSIFKEKRYLTVDALRRLHLERHRRIQRAADMLGTDRIVFLEDDVRCIRRMDEFNDVAVAGPTGVRNRYRESTPYYQALVRRGLPKERLWFNCGGCKVWERKCWDELSGYFTANSEQLYREFGWDLTARVEKDRFESWENFAVGDDRFDGLLALYLGYSTGDAYGVYDIAPQFRTDRCAHWRDTAAWLSRVKFVHQYKRLY